VRSPASAWRGLLEHAREYMTMARSIGAVRDDSARAAASEAMREARQKRNAAELVLLRGSPAEALRLGAESLELLRRALACLGQAGVSGAAGRRRAVERVERFGAALGTLPKLDAAVARNQTASLRGLLRAQNALDRWLDVELLDRGGLLRLRRQRWVLAALILLAPAGVGAFARAALYGIHVRASSELDEQYAADRAIDGDPDTAWTPAGGGEEWLELRFPARRVHSLRILNGDTLPNHAAREVRAEFYLGDKVYPSGVRAFEAQYPPQLMQFDVDGILCDRIRVVIASHYGVGGAIAEVNVN
jgi:hypothetical protein